MNDLTNRPQIVLIGGTSHVGKSTLAKALASKLNGKCIATDHLARHPGRPWSTKENEIIKPHVAEHYRILSVPQLVEDVLIHYQKNVIPQVKNLIDTHNGDRCLIIEGSALYPSLVKDLVGNKNVRGIWLVGNHSLLKKCIYANSNFDNASRQERYLIYKFFQRTWMYESAMVNDLKRWELEQNLVNCNLAIKQLVDKYLQKLDISNDCL